MEYTNTEAANFSWNLEPIPEYFFESEQCWQDFSSTLVETELDSEILSVPPPILPNPIKDAIPILILCSCLYCLFIQRRGKKAKV